MRTTIALMLAAAATAALAQPASRTDRFVITFGSNGSAVAGEAVPILDNVAAAWHQARTAQVLVEAHTDTVGHEQHNLRLSQRRADSVRAYLIGRGVPDSFITSTAFGETKPAAPTGDGASEPRNRRVEIRLGSPPQQ